MTKIVTELLASVPILVFWCTAFYDVESREIHLKLRNDVIPTGGPIYSGITKTPVECVYRCIQHMNCRSLGYKTSAICHLYESHTGNTQPKGNALLFANLKEVPNGGEKMGNLKEGPSDTGKVGSLKEVPSRRRKMGNLKNELSSGEKVGNLKEGPTDTGKVESLKEVPSRRRKMGNVKNELSSGEKVGNLIEVPNDKGRMGSLKEGANGRGRVGNMKEVPNDRRKVGKLNDVTINTEKEGKKTTQVSTHHKPKFLLRRKMTWLEAKTACGLRNITQIKNEMDQAAAVKVVKHSGLRSVAIGAFKTFLLEWQTAGGYSRLLYSDWAPGEPGTFDYFAGLSRRKGYRWAGFPSGHRFDGAVCDNN